MTAPEPTGRGGVLCELLRDAALVQSRLHAGEALPAALQAVLAAADGADSAHAGGVRDLAHAATRHRALAAALLAALAERPAAPPVAALLEVALAQLVDRNYAEFTLVDQAVHAARADPALAHAAGFVNAVLRRFLRERPARLAAALANEAVRLNLPSWWLQRLRKDHPDQWRAIATAQQQAAPLVLRVNRRRSTPAACLLRLAAAGVAGHQVGAIAIALQRPMPVQRVPGFEDGEVSVQDAGAQLAVEWLDARDGMRVLDAGAAPGGKTAHLAEGPAGRIDAVEVDARRAPRIHDNLRRLGLDQTRVRVLVADAGRPETFWDGVRYDRILLDAPCTASGIVSRHPDVVWLRRPADVANLATQQARMLDALWPLLAPAGRLLYAVCSVFHAEGRAQAGSFLGRWPDARALPLPGGDRHGLQLLPRAAAPAPAPYRGDALPTVHDGFYYALFEKT